MSEKFAVFILSHGRADRIKTLKTLKKGGYTGKVYIIIDNFDKTADEYYRLHGKENVFMFDKKKMAEKTDTMDNFHDMRIVVYARNYTFQLAKELGLDYFLVLDDDYLEFSYRYIDGELLRAKHSSKLDSLFERMIDFLEASGATSIAFAQGGDFLGGVSGGILNKPPKRKVMNTFFCKTDRPFQFVGSINEDTNTYVSLGIQGHLFLQTTNFMVNQTDTQQSEGGLTEYYLEKGTYVKSFYTVMLSPSSVKIRLMGENHKRLHHSITWNHTVPKIIDEKYKKGGRT